MKSEQWESSDRAGVPRARARYLTQSMELEEHEHTSVVNLGVLLSATLIFGAIGWAYLTPVAEIARTDGEIIPSGRIHVVQHLEGGIVAAIQVQDGDTVREGDPLIDLDATAAKSELEQIEVRKGALQAKLARIQALLAYGAYADAGERARKSKLPKEQFKLFAEQSQTYAEKVRLLEARKETRERELVAKRNQTEAHRAEMAELQQGQAIHHNASTRALMSRLKVIDFNARMARVLGQLRTVEGEIDVLRASIREAEQRKVEFVAGWRQDLRLEAEEARALFNETVEEQARLADRVARQRIIAPASGVVQALRVNTLNSVIEPGQVILEIVPVEDELVALTRVSPRDIGHLHPGQRVDVKISTFEAQQFGSIQGSLRAVSATTYIDAQQNPYYKAEILLAKNHVGDNPDANRLLPGMTIEANIRTGEKTVLDYILKPVYRGFSNALRER